MSVWRASTASSPGHRRLKTRPNFAHLPWLDSTGAGIPESAWPQMVQYRMDAGWATGGAFYSSAKMVWDSTWAAFFDFFEPQGGVDVFLMPRNPADAIDFVSELTPTQCARTWYSNGQEREESLTTPEERAAYRADSATLKAELAGTGVRCCVELNGSVTYEGSHGGIPRQVEMVHPTDVDFIGWSAFSPGGGDYAINVIAAVAAAMADEWPTIPWGLVAGGVNIPTGTGIGSPLRTTRAGLSDELLGDARSLGSETLAWYDVAHFSTGDYGVGGDFGYPIDQELLDVLVKHATAPL